MRTYSLFPYTTLFRSVLLPGVTVVERLVGRIRDRARTRLWRHLVASLSDDQRARIAALFDDGDTSTRSEEHTSELQSLMRNSYAVFCLKKRQNTLLTSRQCTHTRRRTAAFRNKY